MDSSSQLTLAALHHFAHTGNWGDFPAKSFELSQVTRPKQRKDVLFVTRHPKWDAVIPLDKGEMGVVQVSAVPPRLEFTPGVEIYFGSDGHSMFPRLVASQKDGYDVSAANLPWIVKSLEVATLELGPLADLLNAIKQTIFGAAGTLPPRRGLNPFLNSAKQHIAELAEDVRQQEPPRRFCKLEHAWAWFKGGRQLQSDESDSISEKALRPDFEKYIGVQVPRRWKSIATLTSEPYNRTPLGRKGVFEWKEEELEAWLTSSNRLGCEVGGPVELAFTLSSLPRIAPTSQSSTEEELKASGLWWWDEMESWPEPVKGWFHDNWERSAFYYEFRARRNMRRFGFWPFRVPWAWLGQRERAALYYLWPVLGRPHSFHTEISIVPSELQSSRHSSLLVDVFQPWHEIEAQVRERRSKLAANALPKEKPNWNLLKELDLYWFVEGKMAPKVSNHKGPIEEQYKRVCKSLKLEP